MLASPLALPKDQKNDDKNDKNGQHPSPAKTIKEAALENQTKVTARNSK